MSNKSFVKLALNECHKPLLTWQNTAIIQTGEIEEQLLVILANMWWINDINHKKWKIYMKKVLIVIRNGWTTLITKKPVSVYIKIQLPAYQTWYQLVYYNGKTSKELKRTEIINFLD